MSEPKPLAERLRERASVEMLCQWCSLRQCSHVMRTPLIHSDLSAILNEAADLIDHLKGAMAAQDEREQRAGAACDVPYEEHGCDWPDAVAETVLALRQKIKRLTEAADEVERLRAEVERLRAYNERLRRALLGVLDGTISPSPYALASDRMQDALAQAIEPRKDMK